MNNNKIIPCIWLTTDDGRLSKVIEYYQKVFGKDFQTEQLIPLGQTPDGNSEMCEVVIFGQKFILLNTEKEHHQLNDAVSFVINCNDQQEIDHFWNYFTEEGEASQCGWCMDKYGLRWQVIPENFGELMGQPNAAQVMMKQQKIVIAEYFR